MVNHDQFWSRIIYILSAVVSLAVAFLILGPRHAHTMGAIDVSALPRVNAALNGITTLLLICGFILIKQKKKQQHRKVMIMSFATSTMFLVSYVIYHWFKTGPKTYTGDFTSIYLFILITHIILAAIIVPIALFTLYRGWMSQLQRHKKIARITLPIWLYVSITGVIIFLMLY